MEFNRADRPTASRATTQKNKTCRKLSKFAAFLLVTVIASLALVSAVYGQQYGSDIYSGMRWRLVGPHRAGRVTAVAGIPGQPEVYYFGTPGGGLWKTTTAGRVWQPIFDDTHQAAIGALALAPSNPDIIYVGTGEQVSGNGVYKSTDGGSTWTNVGLRDTNSISSLIVDPHDPNIVLVGAVGPFVPSDERGVFKTTDGGKSWKKVLFKDGKTAVFDMCADPDDSRIVYAATGTLRFNPTEPRPNPGSEILKSNDEGSTWQRVGGAGLPEQYRGRIGIAVAPGTAGKRLYAIMNQGFFRSDDAGEKWERITNDPRVIGSGYFSRVHVNPKNADEVYVMQTATYRSTDGGKTFAGFKGEPSGEDDHVMWIAPDDPERMIMGTDQGAVITVDNGQTWTEWFNQPTGEMYHVMTDNGFPYRLYASQQDTGSVVVPNRSDFGQITFRDWFPSGSFESGYIAPDPANPNFIYSIGWFGTVLRLDRTTNQISTVFVPGPKYRYTWETPLVFSPTDPKTLYVGMQNVLRTTDGAQTWTEISPDLTVKPAPAKQNHHGEIDKGLALEEDEDKPQAPATGVIQTIAPSAAKSGTIWVGTSTGLVQLTRDLGKSWQNVTPSGLPERGAIILIEASPLEADTAYVIAAAFPDSHPYIYRTRDAGKTWQKIVTGLPEKGIARVVREDPARQGLVYAGTETGAYVSFDGGDHWQPLQLNLPTVSVRDLQVHGNDLVAATYGRGLWVLDNLSPLRQLDTKTNEAKVYLFPPETALRVRWDTWPDTPLPADTAAGQNPADGALIDYYLKSDMVSEIQLEIRDDHGRTVRRFSSTPPAPETLPANAPEYWFAPAPVLSTKAGLHRFVWNLQWDHPATLPYSFYGRPLDYIEYTLPDHAIAGQTPRHQPPGPYVVPGRYEVVLIVDGQTYRQPLVVKLDPRVQSSQSDLQQQLDLALQITDGMASSYKSYNDVASLRLALSERQKSLEGKSDVKDLTDAITSLAKELVELQEGSINSPGFGSVNRDLARYLTMIEGGDMRPALSARENVAESCEALKKDLARWRTVNSASLPVLNKLLERQHLATLAIVTPPADPICGAQ